MKIISIAILKGGSGKTTTAINLAAALQQDGSRVLLVDMDPQANLTQSLGILDEPNPNIYHLLRQTSMGEEVEVVPAILEVNGLSLIPASFDLAAAELELVSTYGREQMLQRILAPVQDQFDYVLIDCPPSIGMLTVNALVCSNYVLMPMQAEFLPLKGLESFLRSFQLVKKQINPNIEILGIVLTRFDTRKNMNRNVHATLAERYPSWVFETRIRTNIALANAQEAGVDIFHFDRTSNGAYDYMKLAAEFTDRIS